MRYEYTPWLTGYSGQAAAFDPTREKSIIVSSKTNDIDLSLQRLADVGYGLFSDLIQTSSQAGLPLNITKNDNRQIAPRLGFAWRPFGENMVVRGGYGIFYEAEGTDGRLNFNFLPFRISETLTAAVNAVPNRTLADYWLGVPVGSSLGSVTWVPLPLEAKPGRDQRWNLGFQRQLFSPPHWKSTTSARPATTRRRPRTSTCRRRAPAASRPGGPIRDSGICRCRRRPSRATITPCR